MPLEKDVMRRYDERTVADGHLDPFAHLVGDEFTAEEAAEYLEVSMPTFRRLVASGRLNSKSTVGSTQMFAVPELKSFKRALKTAEG